MSALRRWRLGPRLAAAFSVVVVLLLAVLAAGLSAGASQGAATDRLQAQQRFSAAALTAKYAAADLNGWQTAYAFDAVRAPGALDDGTGSRGAYLDSAGRFEQALRVLADRSTAAETDDDIAQLGALYEQFAATDAQIAAGYRGGDAAAATELVMGREIELYTAMGELLDEVSGDAERAFALARTDAEAAQRRGAVLMWTLGVAGSLVSVLLAVLVTRSVTGPVTAVRDRLVLLAQGDLATAVPAHGRDEVAGMARALQQAVDSLGGTVHRIASEATTLAASSEGLSAVAAELSTGADESASQAQVVSAATEEISANIGTVAAAGDEMSSAIREIATATAEASSTASTAVASADQASAT
ncbi:methyl-accepting chemotaxis protein, partial [Kineococcus aurantiacus]